MNSQTKSIYVFDDILVRLGFNVEVKVPTVGGALFDTLIGGLRLAVTGVVPSFRVSIVYSVLECFALRVIVANFFALLESLVLDFVKIVTAYCGLFKMSVPCLLMGREY